MRLQKHGDIICSVVKTNECIIGHIFQYIDQYSLGRNVVGKRHGSIEINAHTESRDSWRTTLANETPAQQTTRKIDTHTAFILNFNILGSSSFFL